METLINLLTCFGGGESSQLRARARVSLKLHVRCLCSSILLRFVYQLQVASESDTFGFTLVVAPPTYVRVSLRKEKLRYIWREEFENWTKFRRKHFDGDRTTLRLKHKPTTKMFPTKSDVGIAIRATQQSFEPHPSAAAS
jgi:hypothetical protein